VTTANTILSPGRNCESIAPARRVAWLVEGERHFSALADAIERAQRSACHSSAPSGAPTGGCTSGSTASNPPGAFHHQKIVVIDDAIAFCVGLDVTVCRWDTRGHRAEDPRREDPRFPACGSFHDMQLLLVVVGLALRSRRLLPSGDPAEEGGE
jgi:phosphatidylserine/phosphatidylglycerophosphate/cardiolipin synthase-like enzyme